jgi:hypothetical protein
MQRRRAEVTLQVFIPALERADAGDLGKLIEFFYKREERVIRGAPRPDYTRT